MDHFSETASEAAKKVNSGSRTFEEASASANAPKNLLPVCGAQTGPGNCNSEKGIKPASLTPKPGAFVPKNPTERAKAMIKAQELP